MDHDRLLDIFIEEALGHLAALEPDLLEMERSGGRIDSGLVNDAFRAIHSIKGGSGFFALQNIGDLSHAMENALGLLREKKIVFSKPLADSLLAGADVLRSMVDDISSGGFRNIEREINAINQAAGIVPDGIKKVTVRGKHVGDESSCMAFDVSETELQGLVQEGAFLYFIKVFLKKDLEAKEQTPFDFIRNMESTGRFLDAFLDIEGVAGLGDCLEAEMAFVFIYASVLEPDLIPLALDLPEDRITEIETGHLKEIYQKELRRFIESVPDSILEIECFDTGSIPSGAENHENTNTGKDRLIRSDDRIRVSVDTLNDLVNIAGELVLGRNRLVRTVQPIVRDVPDLDEIIQHISRVTTEIQDRIMLMSMQPVSLLFGKYGRMARDLANRLGKDVVLQTSGNEVELDRSIIDALSDPLTHMIRNCVDHGIEMPDVRRKIGKPETGLILLKAFHTAGYVHIEITDDGAGIDSSRIMDKALERGLVTHDQLLMMSEKEILNLIFMPGFSTADSISDISGRGVGMDVVMTNIERLGGTVDIDTYPGKGATVRLIMPLTLAVISGLVIRTGGQSFIIPQSCIVEVVMLDAPINDPEIHDRISCIHGLNVLRFRNMFLPLVNFMESLGMVSENQDRPAEDQPMIIIVLRGGSSLFGIIVDEPGSIEEAVVRPLPRFIGRMKWFSGTSIMGDGSVSFIVDVKGLLEKTGLDLSFHDISGLDNSVLVDSDHVAVGNNHGRDSAINSQNQDM